MRIHPSFSLLRLGFFFIMFFFCTQVHAQNVPEVVPQVVVVQFEAGVDFHGKTTTTGLQVFDRMATTYGVHTIERMYPMLDHVEPTPKTRDNLMALRRNYYVRYSASDLSQEVSNSLSLAPGVVYAEPVPVIRIQGSVDQRRIDPNDPRFSEQTHLNVLNLPEAWDVVKSEDSTPRVVIAIVDGGGEWRHEDLRANVWTNEEEIPGNRIDDDNNGYIDDVHGINLANEDDNDHDPTGLRQTPRNARHGTAVAGTASAVTDNNVGVAGAAWNAELMHINMGCPGPDDDRNLCGAYDGVLYAAMNGADIINASWSGEGELDGEIPRFADEAINLATDMGALVVAAAGNSNINLDVSPRYPALHPRVLSVGSIQNDRIKAGTSNYGKLVNVFSPGTGVITTGSNNDYTVSTGTSMATPLISGVAALVKTRFPNLSPDALREQVRLSSESINARNPGFSGLLGRGLVDALAAVQEPSLPAIRLQNWSWEDQDGDFIIEPGDQVTITIAIVNHLADANQLQVELVGDRSYPFLEWTTSEVELGTLASGDEIEVTFEFTVTPNAPSEPLLQFFLHIRDGAFRDMSDRITLGANSQLAETIFPNLKAFYLATDGDNWIRNDNWDISSVPTENILDSWFGVTMIGGSLAQLYMGRNNLNGTLPTELGDLRDLQVLALFENEKLTGPIPSELGNLAQLRGLYLESNSLTGKIPPELGDLKQLRDLRLVSNSLTDMIPPELGNLEQLEKLHLFQNSLTGMIPPELGNLEQLQDLLLFNNDLSGSIPPELGNLKQLVGLILQNNSLTGSIPSELGELEQLKQLSLAFNLLSGPIPPELGNLEQLVDLDLSRNSLSGPIPPELGNLSNLETLRIHGNTLTGPIPRSFMQLDNLRSFSFTGQNVCAPADEEFQMWLKNIPDIFGSTPICRELELQFVDGIADQSFPISLPITPLILPEAQGGTAPISYTLTPSLPTGLVYDSSTRTISGTPSVVTSTPVPYTFKATDARGAEDNVVFSIEVFGPVASEQDGLPKSFAIYENYPNPFWESTLLVVDLPWPATLDVEVFDVTGRNVLSRPPVDLSAGWGQSIRLEGSSLPSGVYLYRIHVQSEVETQTQTGHLVRMRY